MERDAEPTKRGVICTFYSFKGGVGRSMTLANVATALAGKNQQVLLIDWDLEAPGLDEFFAGHLIGSRQRTPGLVDLFEAHQRGEAMHWQDCLLQARPRTADPIHLLHAGRDDGGYIDRLRRIRWDGPPEDGLGDYLEVLRREWKESYDFILIDSRTGLTDMGGICAVHLPDILVPLFTTTNQSIKGVADVARRARAARAEMTVDRTLLHIVPVPTRDETNNEYKKAEEWRRRYARALEPYMTSWLPKDVTAEHVFDRLRIPYVAFWSFGEELPVLSEDAGNPKTLAYSYELVARLLGSRLEWSEVGEGAKAASESVEQAARIQAQAAEAAARREEALGQAERRKIEAETYRLETARQAIQDRFARLRLQANAKARWHKTTAAVALLLMAAFFALAIISNSAWFNSSVATPLGIAPGLILTFIVVMATAMAGAALAAGARQQTWDAIVRRLDRERAELDARVGDYDQPDLGAWQLFAVKIERIAEGATDRGTAAPTTASPVLPTAASTVAALPSPVPAAAVTPAPLPERIDVTVLHSGAGLAASWVREFVPMLTLWMGETLGREAVVHTESVSPGDEDAAIRAARIKAFQASGRVLVIVSRRLVTSDAWPNAVDELGKSFAQDDIFKALLDDSLVGTPGSPIFANANTFDFAPFAFLGEGFAKSERYVAFQQQVQALAVRMTQQSAEQSRRMPAA